jgi:ABC-type multidrug transport system fused ATPase/permease subunit
LLKGRTSLVIAHRLATIRPADKIIVLQRQRIVEQGPHRELIERGGLNAHLNSHHYPPFDDLEGANDT